MATHITVDCSKPNNDAETYAAFMTRMAENTTVRVETPKEEAARAAAAAAAAAEISKEPPIADRLAAAGIDLEELKALLKG